MRCTEKDPYDQMYKTNAQINTHRIIIHIEQYAYDNNNLIHRKECIEQDVQNKIYTMRCIEQVERKDMHGTRYI